MTLKLGISGVRGIVNESLTDDVTKDLSRAFATYIHKGTVIIGRDTRPSGKDIEKLVISKLLESGINVLYAGIAATPTMQVLVKKLKANGGIVITASHNPIEWNGFKFISPSGIFLNEKENNKLFDIYRSKKFVSSKNTGKFVDLIDANKHHIDAVLDSVDIKAIRSKHYKVIIDSCNGAGSIITPQLLKAFGCDVIEINTDTNSPFPRGAEPTPENLNALCDAVRKHKADIGFAQDPDADRLAVVNDKGKAVGEEYTMVLAGKYVLMNSKKGSIVATNLSTSRMIDDVAGLYDASVLRSKVGEINVVEKLIKSKAVFGGEGNGGVIYPKVVTSRDSLTGISLILSLMAKENKNISSIIDEIPSYVMIKTKITCRSKDETDILLNKTKKVFAGSEIDEQDGIKVIFDDSWIHVRASNTEPVVRVIAEARTKDAVEVLLKKLSS
jgi:phosphomannomutase